MPLKKLFPVKELTCSVCGVEVQKRGRNGLPPVCYPCWEFKQKKNVERREYERKQKRMLDQKVLQLSGRTEVKDGSVL